MTAQEIIEKIRAEVNRLCNEHLSEDGWDRGYNYACEEIMSILSDIEKEEKPTNPTLQEQPVELEKEIQSFWLREKEKGEIVDGSLDDFITVQNVARHFYEFGRSEKPNNHEGLDEAANEFSFKQTHERLMENSLMRKDEGVFRWQVDYAFKKGAKWDREQMMKEAVEGYISATNEVSAVLALPKGDFKKGDKVRIIIVKEDEK